MQRWILMLAGLGLLCAAGNAPAEPQPDHFLLTGYASYVTMKSALTSENVDGAGIGLSFEKIYSHKEWTFGLGVGYTENADDFTASDGSPVHASFSNFSTSLFGRYLGRLSRVFTSYIGLGLGVRFTGGSRLEGDDYVEDSETGLILSVPIGLFCFISQTIYLDANYTYNYMGGSSFIEDSMAHNLHLGIGFQLK